VLNAVVRDELPTRVLLVTSTSDAEGGYDAIAAGACGWFSKTSGEQELCDAVTTIATGRTAFCRDVQTSVASEIRRRARRGDPILSERERAILTLVACGWSVGRIGRELHVSPGTVKSVLLRVYKRLGVSERAAAVAVALRRGLIE
jgi:two-component system nitrate/nitrite response regulator NarL